MKKINIGLVGFGIVGSGLHSLLEKNSSLIAEKTGIDISLKTICDIRTDHVEKHAKGINVTDKWENLIKDDEIDIIVELIGGIEPAKSIIIAALDSGKSVVTANKKLLAEEGAEIFSMANSGKARIGFEASVGGGIPCIMSLSHGLVGNRVRSVMGILNGTTNYILSKMEDDDMPFPEALKDAQEKGFAEADPTFDIEGYDAGHKIALLSMIAFNKNIDFGSIPIEGITNISKLDISYAHDMGYVIKLLGISKYMDGRVDIRVHPTMIPGKHPLASVRDEYNAVMFDCDMTDPVTLTGKGAGSCPTASAVLSDITLIAGTDPSDEIPRITKGDAEYIKPGERISRYYLRMHTEEMPGIMSKITGVLGQHNISISSVIQKEVNDTYIPLFFMTHESREDEMLNAMNEIKGFDFVHGEVMLIRVEDSLT